MTASIWQGILGGGVASGLFNSVFEKICYIGLFFEGIIYWLADKLFNVFYSLAKVDILNDNVYTSIANNFLTVVGVIMLFYLAYALLKALVNPDDLKNTSKIATNLVISLVLITLVPSIFNYAFKLQNAILNDHIIDQIVFGRSSNAEDIPSTGRIIIVNMVDAFVDLKEDDKIDGYTWSSFKGCLLDNTGDDCDGTESFMSVVKIAKVVGDGATYVPFVGLACAIFLCYMLISFCIDLGIRVFKLAFYQIISPVPILMYIIPEKKSVFEKWVKAVVACFLEVFIRLFLMFIVCFLATKIFSPESVRSISKGFGSVGLLGKIFLVLGLFAFMKQAPKLISEATGISSEGLKLGIGKKLNEAGPLGKGLNFLGTSTRGLLSGGLGGAYTALANGTSFGVGLKAGALNGWKGKGKQFSKQRQYVYSAYGDEEGAKGKAGLFGGRQWLDAHVDSTKKKVKNDYYEQKGLELKEMQQGKGYQEALKKAKEKYIVEISKKDLDKMKEFQTENQEKLANLLRQQQIEKEKFEKDKSNKLDALNRAQKAAELSGDMARRAQIQRELNHQAAAEYRNDELENSINSLKNARYVSPYGDLSRFNGPNPQFTDDDMNTIKQNADMAYRDQNDKYKATSKAVATHKAEEEAKKWRESHLDEALAQETMYENAFKNANKAGGAGGLGGLGGASSSSGSSSSSSSSSGGSSK